jgi:uncharacterized repeat protein (TIGR02543 family)
VTFSPDNANPSVTTSTITASTPHTADGSDASTVTVQLKDANGNNLTAGGQTVVVSADGSAQVSAVTDNTDGTYTATITNTVAETITVSATVGGQPITSGNASVVFVPGAASQLVFTSSEAGLPVEDSRALTVEIRDAQGNVVTDDSGREVVFSATAGPGIVTGLGTTQTSGGEASRTVVGAQGGPVTIEATSSGLIAAQTSFEIIPIRAIGGAVSGLAANGLVLQLNGANDLPVGANGSFQFDQRLPEGSDYRVTVLTQPGSQTCSVTPSTAQPVGGADILDVQVSCTTGSNATTHLLAGDVTGLAGSGLVLFNNGGDALPISANGPFVFDPAYVEGTTYAVTVGEQPVGQTCSVSDPATGELAADVTSLEVSCSTNGGVALRSVGGTLSGLQDGSVVLSLNDGFDDLTLSTDGNFTFPTALTEGSEYAVTVTTQPEGQLCLVTNGTDTLGAANVTNVAVDCQSLDGFFVVSATAGANGNLVGDTVKVVAENATASFEVAADAGYTPATPTGTCPSGSFAGSLWTTGPITADCSVTFSFTANDYTLSFDAQGGTVSPVSIGVTLDAPIGQLPIPTREGYTFSGWNTAPDGTGATWGAATVYSIAGNSTLYAQWTVKDYTITFDSAGGSAVAPITQAFGTAITPPADPTREGYTFAGWNPAVPASMPAGDLTLVAQWSLNTFPLSVIDGTGDGDYAPGTVVPIAASAPPADQVFDAWTGDTAFVADPSLPSTTVTMPEQAVSVTATYKAAPPETFALTVTNGSGSGEYTAGTQVTITASPAPDGQVFDQWAGDVGFVANVNLPTTDVLMPEAAMALTATYKDAPPDLFALTVTNGTGTGEYEAGRAISIAANPAPEGRIFDRWSGDLVHVESPLTPNTTVVMPAEAIAVTALYKDRPAETFALTVLSGSGSGEYPAGQTVTIAAEPAPEGQVFDRWRGDTAYLASPNAPNTEVVMPAEAVSVEATYKAAPPETFALTVTSGTGSGRYEAGEVITIAAEPAADGEVFARWSGQTAQVTNVNLPNTTLTMPASDVSATALYEAEPETAEPNTLTVVDGTGDGSYDAGRVVLIAADVREGELFDRWIGQTAGVNNVNIPNTTLVMPDGDVTVTATFKPDSGQQFRLRQLVRLPDQATQQRVGKTGPEPGLQATASSDNVIDDREVPAGLIVRLFAPEAPAGFVFDKWVGQTTHVNNIHEPETFVYMPTSDVEISATYREQVSAQTLTVDSGSGDGSYMPGTEVTITASAAPSGFVFDRWEGQTAQVANVNRPETIMTMPQTSVRVQAVYRELPPETFALEVLGGSGDGSYQAGREVTIVSQAPPADQVFARWSGQVGTVADIFSAQTSIYMPANQVTVVAQFANVYTVSATIDGSGGTLSPASQEIVEGERAVIQITPDSGWVVDAVSGCGGGTLSKNTWTSAQINAECSIQVLFAQEIDEEVMPVPVPTLNPWALLLLILATMGVANIFVPRR